MKTTIRYLTFLAGLTSTLIGSAQPAVPAFVKQPTNHMLYPGGATSFSVIATGAPPPTFQWRFQGIDLPGKTNSVLVVNVQFTNAGPYSVLVSNDAGSVTSQIAWLSVVPTNVVNLGDRELRFGAPSATNIWEGPRIDDQSQSVTGDCLTLFYASTAPGGSGGLDIWMITRPTLSSPWGTPVNLGPNINSAADENDPRLSPDGLSLYFNSTRSGGFGNYDIWVATRPTLTAPFDPAVNLGSAINTGADDGIPQISADQSDLSVLLVP